VLRRKSSAKGEEVTGRWKKYTMRRWLIHEISFHYCSTFIYHRPLRCAIALSRQHFITFPAFKLGASSLTLYLAAYRPRKPRHVESMGVEKCILSLHSIWNAEWKRPPRNPRHSWEEGINTGLEELHYENLKLIQLAQKRVLRNVQSAGKRQRRC
jgi:hypothetical protein